MSTSWPRPRQRQPPRRPSIPTYKIESGTGSPDAYPKYDDPKGWCYDCDAADWTAKKISGPTCVDGVDGNCCDLSKYTSVKYNANAGGGFNVCKDQGTSGDAPWLTPTPGGTPGCDGVAGSGKVVGGCDNACGSTKINDACGVCGGDGSSCDGNSGATNSNGATGNGNDKVTVPGPPSEGSGLIIGVTVAGCAVGIGLISLAAALIVRSRSRTPSRRQARSRPPHSGHMSIEIRELKPGTTVKGWEVVMDSASGDKYYHNPMTGQTSWEPPSTNA